MAETRLMIHSACPFFQGTALGEALAVRLSLRFQHQHPPRFETNEKIRPVLSHNSSVKIENLETEMVVLYPRIDQGVMGEFEASEASHVLSYTHMLMWLRSAGWQGFAVCQVGMFAVERIGR